jgi:acyl-CoA reductase-like NAD-dependent aldehyde dehydrogenase
VPRKSARLSVLKTYKLFIGGKFPRGESGRAEPAFAPDGTTVLANVCAASRKDFRDAVVAARKAQPGWAAATPYLRGQILYRTAEMAERRRAELIDELARAGSRQAAREVDAAIDRLVHHAGWTDKFAALYGSVNPVASPHFSFTFPEPMGVVVCVCPDAVPVLGLVSLVAPAILSGNACIALASERAPLPALTFSEVLATSDLPGGVVNILCGHRAELAPHFASHLDVNAIVDASGDPGLRAVLRAGSATNLKRYAERALPAAAWFGAKAEAPEWMLDTVELKTAWHPIGI